VTEQIRPGSLKLVVACSADRSLREPVEGALLERCGPDDVRHLHADTFLVHTEASAADIRDWLAPLLAEDESLFVVEFERWSARGPAAGRDWLRARGH